MRAEVRITRDETGAGYTWALHILGPAEPTPLGYGRAGVARHSGKEPTIEWCCVELAWLAWQYGVDRAELVVAHGGVR